ADRAYPRHHRRSSKSSDRSAAGDKRQGGPAAVRVRQGTRHRHGLSPTRVVAWLHGDAGKRRPLIAHLQDLAHLVEKFSLRVIATPAPALREIGEVLLPALDEREPSARDTSYGLFCRSDIARTKSAVESPLLDNQRASAIPHQQKMN